MILHDGTDTRVEASGPGRYYDGMAVVLQALALDSSEDDFAGDFTVTGTATRFGRRILFAETSGFLSSETYPTVEDAEAVMVKCHETMDVGEDW